jgi:hypothetical protein
MYAGTYRGALSGGETVRFSPLPKAMNRIGVAVFKICRTSKYALRAKRRLRDA